MITSILNGMLAILTPETLFAIFFGLFVGLLFGAIPGISGIMAISILLPITFSVGPLVGIPLLMGIYKASFFGGSITAILLNTPGAPPAVCTAMDGFPLAKQGKAGKALNAALVGSVFGDAFSNILLICVAAPLSMIAIKLGPCEQFCLLLLAITVVGSISGPSLCKGIICACLGILLSSIGLAGTGNVGAMRFTFGSDQLMGGIALIPMVIGLLCLPEIVHQVGIKVAHIFDVKCDLKGENGRLTWKEFKQNIVLLLRSSIIGSIIGILPGLGASPAAFMSYSEAQRHSSRPELFGKGNVEGVLAPEAANNAVTGSAMIPLLTLGIPGDDVTAILMGAFLIQGITPGPNIFYEHTEVVYGIFASLLVCDLFLYAIAKFGFRLWIRIIDLPRWLIFSVVTVFAFLGTYSINQSFFDIFCLIIFGILGYFMRCYKFSVGAVIIGFILGPLLERSFDQSMTLSDGNLMIFVTRPICIVILLLTIITIVSIFRSRRRVQARDLEKFASTSQNSSTL